MNPARIYFIARRTFMLTFRGLDPLSDFFYWPLFDIILWGLAGTWISEVGGDNQFAVVILSSLVLWQACYRSNLDISFNLLNEMWAHNIINLFVTPLSIQEWAVSVMLTGALNACISAVCGTLAVWFLYHVSVISMGWILLPIFVMLFISGWVIGLACASVLITIGPSVQKLVWIMGWFFTPFTGIFYPVESMPLWAQTIAYSVPMTYFFKFFRTYSLDGRLDWHLFLMGACMNFVYLAIAFTSFIWLFHRSRARGLARLEGS